MPHGIILPVMLVVGFLAGVSLFDELAKRFRVPFVVVLLVIGFLAKGIVSAYQLPVEHSVSPDFIFYVLLPLLLFGGALHINVHQFKLQVRTITFLATFGLLLSVFLTGVMVWLALGLPLLVALLFGALISATDPIAVLAIFKSLGAPKRLSLLADGESMFNDATAVVVFRALLAFVLGTAITTHGLVMTGLSFVGIFVGSIVVGAVLGLVASSVIEQVEDDAFVETTVTLVTALGTFLLAEHFLHLSGVIATVIAGIVVGNLGTTKISAGVVSFIDEFWEYVSTLAIAIVFFFAAFDVELSVLADHPEEVLMVIAIVLVARAASVYLSLAISNYSRLFSSEPNVMWSWQHVLNWGGLRGVIPLVLVFSLPETFVYKDQLLVFTLGVLLFSLFFNGLTIEWLMKLLGLQVKSKEEDIIEEEMTLFEIERAKQKLSRVPDVALEKTVISGVIKKLEQQEERHRKVLMKLASGSELQHSLELQALRIERSSAHQLWDDDVIDENVFLDLEAQLDVQTDVLEYPELQRTRALGPDGELMRYSLRRRVRDARSLLHKLPLLGLFGLSPDQVVIERYQMLKARIVGNEAVIDYLAQVKLLFRDDQAKQAVADVERRYARYKKHNLEDLRALVSRHKRLVEAYQLEVAEGLVDAS